MELNQLVINSINKQFKSKLIATSLLVTFFIAIFVVLAIYPTTATLLLIVLCVWALVGVEQSIKALSLSAIVKFLSPALYQFPENTTILFFVVMFIASARCLLSINIKKLKLIFPLISFYLVVIGISIYSSASTEVSIMKVTFFTLMTSAILTATYKQKTTIVDNWKVWFLGLSIAIIVTSLLTLPFPQIAYFRNGRGFQGVFNQPQVLGPWSAVLAVWILFALLQGKKIKTNLYLFLCLGLLVTFIVASKARTGMITFLLSASVTYIVVMF